MAALGDRLATGAELDRVTWPLARLHALRDERLRAAVANAKQRSRWHAFAGAVNRIVEVRHA